MSAPVIPGTCSRRDRYFTLVISKSFQSPPAGRHPPEEPNQRVRRNVSLPACSKGQTLLDVCLLYTSDAADDLLCVDLGGRRIIKKKKKSTNKPRNLRF